MKGELMRVYVLTADNVPEAAFATQELADIWAANYDEWNRGVVERQGPDEKIEYKVYPLDLIGDSPHD